MLAYLILLLAISVLAMLAKRAGASYAIAFVLGGIGIAYIPGMPHIVIPPEWILPIFLPPLLMEAAFYSSFRDLRANVRPILQLAVGAVIVSAVATAWVFQWLEPTASLALALTLGAIISPPDAVAAKSSVGSAPLPKRVVTVLEGESLINDATGLVLYKFALAAVLTSSVSLVKMPMDFLYISVVGVGIGFVLGAIYVRIFCMIGEQSVEILSTFMLPYAAYMLAESVHGSGVLATVTCGLVLGWRAPMLFSAQQRLPTEAVWQMVVFVLNAAVFLMIGMEFPSLLARLSPYGAWQLAGAAAAVTATVIIVRFLWVYGAAYGTRWLFSGVRVKDPAPPWQNVFIVAWTGMRGVVSLATALALPLVLPDGTAFPHRDLIIFLSFSVIFCTLILQGMTLPWLTRQLSLTYDYGLLHEAWSARVEALRNVLGRMDELAHQATEHPGAVARIRSYYEDRLASMGDGPNTPISNRQPPKSETHPMVVAENCIWQKVLEVERKTVIAMRHAYRISDDVMYDILRDVDLLTARYQIPADARA